MARQRHLPHAPITEALIDIQVTPRDGLTFAGLKNAIEAADSGYYVKGPISEGTFAFTLAPEGKPQTAAESAQVGLRLHSPMKNTSLNVDIAGFTLSRLPPYEAWPNLLEEARRFWAIYVERLAPTGVVQGCHTLHQQFATSTKNRCVVSDILAQVGRCSRRSAAGC